MNSSFDPSSLRTDLFIDGTWQKAASGATFAVENPATNEVIAHVADGGPEDAARAIEAAGRAQAEWARSTPRERADILRRAFELVIANTERLAAIMTAEMGKPLAEARGEVAYGADMLRWFSEEAVRVGGDATGSVDGNTRILVTKEPVGPSVLVTPWNFPLAMGARKIAPAVAAGCTMVFKPAELTPLTSLALVELFKEAGLPDGVLNVVTTSSASVVVRTWTDSGLARKISFTGSTEVGKVLLRQAADNVMRSSMELGGNAPFIVLADADIEKAVEGAMKAKMRNMGEACTAANRFFVHRSVLTEFSEKFAKKMSELRVGNGALDGTDVGPLIEQKGLDKVQSLVDDAVSKGARVLTGGGRPEGQGYFYSPTVLVDVPGNAQLMSTEIFGPVAAITAFDSEEEVLQQANDTEWGLVGYVFTESMDKALKFSAGLEVGMVGINTGLVSNPAAPFGGVKQSGLGREGGKVGIDEFLEYKYTAIAV
ncbi:NAD-dependent succinate-semialdehyde dehydrogenase [Paenarthrobacter ureafaciens]|uniref:NAD-dependent succinate-semialdehyde dehydrogenase n=1 Tax=Paenarthrobacter nitroguajacolicus TaxID=211146 RepID=A0A558H6G3_PAENT|nr:MULTISPECIES: NAD-dependent succinate-semialdehyde dehydrogenase [Paenarthrobacter]NWL26221.1 NAD-dependent succinate-semialdehyde dehydrogenase [Paenarthrobacter ureafaciens]NWL27207.1 NAD-dependent succinate-semialdehyde dehydrogenase [Paenarthrobacter ureafaciens]NWL29236.1 NAD-dependent succinate-semialdehyde dehydrogenase [Paenarthrobacter ureafaciens]NWL29329.1 NAD-dependent succinate-semialdehyde dehydrogenase [Paenarthrobacter ureafaciens]TVU64716.1 NAD-dependent succinate-semialdeh